MSYKLLTRESMISLTEPLVDENHEDCRSLKADPVGAALWPFIAQAHTRLLNLQRLGPTPERLKEIMNLETWHDGLHDDYIRGIWYMFLSVEFLQEQPDDREPFRRLRNKLLPGRLGSTQRSYRDESGQASLASSRLDAADWALLRSIWVPGGLTLADAVERWFAHAAKLGELENERASGVPLQQPTGAEILAARHGWIRAVRALHDAFALNGELPANLRRIVRRFDEVVARAARRRQGQGQGEGEGQGQGQGQGQGDVVDDIAPDVDIEPDIDINAAAEVAQVMMAGEAIESTSPETHTGAQGGSGA